MKWIKPEWPAPASVRAISTLRSGGFSQGPYHSLNLGLHVGDEADRVQRNREQLETVLELPQSPFWLSQVHGHDVVEAGHGLLPEADASFTDQPGVVCGVMTADCLPILLTTRDGRQVAAVHAGWKGLAYGIVAATIEAMGTQDLMAWLGPAIGPTAFEVREDLREVFLNLDQAFDQAFIREGSEHFLANIALIARMMLIEAGVNPDAIYGGHWCTHNQPADFFSYRRDGTTGRMATLIWRTLDA